MSDEKMETTIERFISIERLKDSGGKTTLRASLSSESAIKDWPWAPPMRLLHTDAAINMERAGKDGLPMLFNHDRSNIIGRIKNVKRDGKRLVGDLVFSEVSEDARQIRALVDEGTLTDMSISVQVNQRERIEDGEGNVERVDVTAWTPVEASVVTVAADASVGIGRSNRQEAATAATLAPAAEVSATTTRAQTMGDEVKVGQTADEKAATERVERAKTKADETFAAENEARRKQAIVNLGKTNGVGENTVQEWIARGYSLDRVADDLLKIFEERGKRSASQAKLDLSAAETSGYSLTRAILAAHSGDWKNAGLERECTDEIAKRLNKPPAAGTFYVPLDVQRRAERLNPALLALSMNPEVQRLGQMIQRDLTVASGGGGGYTVQTSVQGFDELLRNISFAFRMGVQRLSGLRDSITIPRQSAAATAEWLTSESDTPAESQQTFVQLALAPKTISAYTEISRQLLLQSTIDVEGFVAADLAAASALGVDVAVLSGSGASGQPTGLDNTAGIGAVTGTTIGYPGVLNFQEDVAAANVMPLRGGYVTTPAVASLLMQRVKFTGTASPLWEGNLWTGSMAGFPAMSTNQVAAATMYFGDWAKALVAEWGILEIDTNPFAGFTAGIIGVRAMYSVDVGIRYPAAFSRATTIT